jgi:hypothetical protein
MTPGLFPGGPVVASALSWKPLRISGGGLCHKINFASDGSRVTASDVGGGYIAAPGQNWVSVFGPQSMPSLAGTFANGNGCCDILFAPGNPNRLYGVYPVHNKFSASGLWTSTNKGATLTLTAITSLTAQASDPNQHDQVLYGHIIAVSPANDAVFLFGNSTLGIVQLSVDGGATVSTVSAIPTPTGQVSSVNAYYYGLDFDPTSSGNRAVVPSWGNQCTVGTSILSTPVWTPTTGGPTHVTSGDFSLDGYYYCSNLVGTTTEVWRLSPSNTWAKIYTSSSYNLCVACHPTTAATIALAITNGSYQICTNANAATPTFPGFTNSNHYSAPAGQSTWQVASNDNFATLNQIAFDPLNPTHLWGAAGNGTFYVDITTYTGGGTAFWNIEFNDITNMAPQSIAASPSGKAVSTQWDRPLFTYDLATNAGCSTYGPAANLGGVYNVPCTVDYCRQTPTFWIAVVPLLGVTTLMTSSDNGATWISSPTQPNTLNSAQPQAATTTDWMVADFGNAVIRHTLNGGSSWNTPGGLPAQSSLGTNTRISLAADTVTIGDYYAYIPGHGVYYYAAGSGTWVQQNSSLATALSGNDSGAMNFKAAFGAAGVLAVTCGPNGGSAQPHPNTGVNAGLFISTDKGVTWSAATGVQEPQCLGWGITVPGDPHPSLFFYGWLGGAMGTYRSGDYGSTWEFLGEYNGPSWGVPVAMDGDKVNQRQVVVLLGFESAFSGAYYTV